MEKRDIKIILEEIEQVATIDIDIALSCFYVLFSDDSKPFTGISVRFAEIIASSWGNIETGSEVVRNDGKTVTVSGFVRDLEKNSRFSVQIQKSIQNLSPEQKILAITTASSIAFRNAVFKAVPAAIFTTVIKKIKSFIVDNLEGSKSLVETLDFFHKKGISDSDISKRLNIESLKDINSDDLFMIIGIKNAIEEGSSTVEQVFNKPKPRKSKFVFDSKPLVEEVEVKENCPTKLALSAMSQEEEEGLQTNSEKEKIETNEPKKLHRQPRGRTPKGKIWDAVKGEFVLKENSSQKA